MLFEVLDLGIIPLYDCNLLCDFCLFSHCRTGSKKVLSLDFLKNVLEILKAEGNHIQTITVFGGEISLCPLKYLKDIFKLVRKFFPEAVLGVTSNFVAINSEFIDFVFREGVEISTSYDNFRFSGRKSIYRSKWMENVKRISDLTGESPLVIVADSEDIEDVFGFLKSLSINRIQPIRLYVPDEAPENIQTKIMRYTFPPSHYIRTCNIALKFFEEVHFPNENGTSIINTLLILPENRVVIHGPSEKGYPFEKFYHVYPNKEESITYSSSRLEYISSFVSSPVCTDCTLPIEKCLAEIRYPEICTGKFGSAYSDLIIST